MIYRQPREVHARDVCALAEQLHGLTGSDAMEIIRAAACQARSDECDPVYRKLLEARVRIVNHGVKPDWWPQPRPQQLNVKVQLFEESETAHWL